MAVQIIKEIEQLQGDILSIGSLVEEALRCALKAAVDNDIELAKKVIKSDRKIDEMEVEVEEECLKVLALHQPVAVDLRYIIAILKMNNDLERIGDLAANIAKKAKFLAKRPPVDGIDRLQKMGKKAQQMLRKSLDAIVNVDAHTAASVREMDDVVDDIHKEIFELIETKIANDPERIGDYLRVLGISRNLERIGDHATNIAEDAIYLSEGDIVRHRQWAEDS